MNAPNNYKYQTDNNALDDKYMIACAKIHAINKIENGLSVEETIRLAFTNPAFKTVFSTQLQAELFQNDLNEFVMNISKIIHSAIAQELYNAESKYLIEKYIMDIEYIESMQSHFNEYCMQLTVNENLQQEKERQLKDLISLLSNLLNEYLNMISKISNEIKLLEQKKSAIVGENALLNREIFKIISDGVNAAILKDEYIVPLIRTDKDGNQEITEAKLTGDEIKKYVNDEIRANRTAFKDIDYSKIIEHAALDKAAKLDSAYSRDNPNRAAQSFKIPDDSKSEINNMAHDVKKAIHAKVDHIKLDKATNSFEENRLKINVLDRKCHDLNSVKSHYMEKATELKNNINCLNDVVAQKADVSFSLDDIINRRLNTPVKSIIPPLSSGTETHKAEDVKSGKEEVDDSENHSIRLR